jgi:hypothetical protein
VGTAPTTAQALIRHRGSLDLWGRDRAALAEHAALREKLNEEARENWDNPEWHRQVARDVASSLDYGFTFDNLFGSYLQVETVGEFDRVILRERRGLRVFYTSRGGYIEESQLRTENWELPRDTLGFHVSEHIDKLRANFADTMEDVVGLGQARLEAEVNRRMFNLLQESIPQGSPFYDSGAAITPETLDELIIEVNDAIQPNGLGPVPVTIIGRATAIDQISRFDGFADEAKEEIRLRGRLGIYRGANIVRVTNYTDENGAAYIPANELWVMGGTVGKFALYGGLLVKSWEENTVDYRHYRARKDIGGLIHHPEQARRFVITS